MQVLVAKTIIAGSVGQFTPVGLLWDPETEDIATMTGRKMTPQKHYEINGYSEDELRELSRMILAGAYPELNVISQKEYDALYASLGPQRRARWEQSQKEWYGHIKTHPIGEVFAHRRPQILSDGSFVTRIYNPCAWTIKVPTYAVNTLAGLPPDIVIPARTYAECVDHTVAVIAKWRYVRQSERPAWWYEYAGERDGYELHESGKAYDVVCPTSTAMGRVYS